MVVQNSIIAGRSGDSIASGVGGVKFFARSASAPGGTANAAGTPNSAARSMRVSVVAVLDATDHFFQRHYATFQLAAPDVLKLHGGVADAIVIAQHMIQFCEDACAL